MPKAKLKKGLDTLNRLWKRGLFPKDLERHYFLHWFVVYSGNILKTADALQIHRNTIQGHFLTLGYSKRSVKLRHAWQKMKIKFPKFTFENCFAKFFQQYGKNPRLSPEENAGLISLWQIKFPFKTLVPHYLLWAIRVGKSREWVQKKLDYSYRHRARLLSQVLKTKARDGFWLSSLKPTFREIHSPRYRVKFFQKSR